MVWFYNRAFRRGERRQLEEILPNSDYCADFIAIVIVIIPEVIVANVYIWLSSNSESVEDIARSLQKVHVNLPSTGGYGGGDVDVVVGDVGLV